MSFFMWKILFFLAFVSLTATAVQANDGVVGEEVLVTATAEPDAVRTGEVDQVLTTGFSQSIKREQFEGRVATLADIVGKQSGIQIRQSGGLGSFSTVTLRGASSEQVLIFVDGLLLNDAAGGGVDLSSISLADVESVEVYRGATPMSLGQASIGGAINIRTLKAVGEATGNFTVGYGDFDTKKISAFVTHKLTDWDYVVSAEHLASDGDFEIFNDNGTPLNPNDDRVEDRHNNQFDQNNLLVKLGYDLSTDLRVDGLVQFFKKNLAIPSWNNHPDTRTHYDTERLQSQLRVISNNVGAYGINMSGKLEYLRSEEEYDDRNGDIGISPEYDRYSSTSLKARYFFELPLDIQLISFNIEISEENYSSLDLLRQTTKESDRSSFSFGLEDKLFLFNDRVLLNAGVFATLTRDFLAEMGDVQRDHVDPRIGIKIFSTDSLTVKSNLGRYTREPTFFEMLGDRGLFVGNDQLKNETGINFDLGFELAISSAVGAVDNIDWQASYFYSDVDDIIARTYNARNIGKALNIDRVEINGIETALSMELFSIIDLSYNLTWQDARNRADLPSVRDKKLPGRFAWTYNTRIEVRLGRFSPFIEHLYQEEMYYDTPNNLPATDKESFDVGLSWSYKPVELTLEVQNLTDEPYEDFSGFPQPGRAAYATLKTDL